MDSSIVNTLNIHKTQKCDKKKYFNFESLVGKENIESKSKIPSILVPPLHNVSSGSPLSSRLRKNSDESLERHQRTKGLQEIGKSNHVQSIQPKRRHHSASDTNTSKPFVKTQFTIYNDTQAQSNDDTESTAKIIYFKQNQNQQPKKKPGLRIKSSLPLVKNIKPIASPKNLPLIPTLDVSKIKEIHKNASTNKVPRAACDDLPLQLAYNTDYMSEFIRFQMELSQKRKLSEYFLTKSVTVDQRRLIVKYLIKVTAYYKYPSFILYQAIKIFDSYIDANEVSVMELQTIALAALWITLKKELIFDDIPMASTIIELAGSHFKGDKEPLIEYERKILMSLKFEISFNDPFSMLALFTVMVEEVQQSSSKEIQDLYYCGCYLIDLSLLHEKMYDISSVHLAMISAEIALVLVMTNDNNIKNPQWSYWRNRIYASLPALENYRLSDTEMNDIKTKLLQKVILSKDNLTDFHVVYRKYSSKRYGPVSNFIISKTSFLYVQKIRDSDYDNTPICFH